MLTNTSGINNFTGYQAQLNIPNAVPSSNREERSSSSRKDNSDTVNISSKARALQQAYQTQKTSLEQNYNSDAQQLEREYALAKNRLEREFSQKKQSLELHVSV